jgi:autotransporter-associated beta strand protein
MGFLSSLFANRKIDSHRKDSSKRSWHRKCGIPRSSALVFEPLEQRQLLAVLTWDPDCTNDDHYGCVSGQTDNWTKADAWVDTSTNVRYTWNESRSGDEAVFLGDAGMVNVDTNINAASLMFQVDDYSLNGSELTLTGAAATITATGSATIGSATSAGSSQQWSVATGKTLSISGDVALSNYSLNMQGQGNTTISGDIVGTGGIRQSGLGISTLTGANTYTGGTSIQAGRIAFAAGGLGAGGAVDVAGNSTLQWLDGNSQDISSRLSMSADVNVTLDVGVNTVSFATAVCGIAAAPASVIKTGSGVLSLTGSERFDGVTIEDGTLEIRGENAATLCYGDIIDNGTLVFNSNGSLCVGGAISGDGAVTQKGTGALVFAETNTYGGGTTIDAGTLIVGASGNMATAYTLTAQLSAAVAGEIVTFIDDTSSTIIGSARTNASGVATIAYVVTADAVAGAHQIRATFHDGSQTGSLTVPSAAVSEWQHRKQITISNANVDADLTNFPLCVKISNDSEIGEAALANGYDIRFTAADGVTLLDYERESWSGGGGSAANGVFWVKVPTVSHASATTIFIYYGKSDAADGQNVSAVWDASYKGVWHLPNGTTLSVNDSTTNASNGTNNGAVAAAGEVGGGARFNGSSSYIAVPRVVQNDWTVSFWVNPAANGSTGTQWYNGYGLVDGEVAGVANDFGIAWVGNKIAFGVGNADTTIFSSALSLNTWHYVTATRVSSTGQLELYVDGAKVAGIASGPTGVRNAATTLNLGKIRSDIKYFNGSIDETRMSCTVRSAAWTKFEYYNLTSTTGELSWIDPSVDLSSFSISQASTAVNTTATLIATLSDRVAGAAITFFDDTTTTVIGTAFTDANGQARISYPISEAIAIGTHAIRATYRGTSETAILTVTPASISEWAYRKQITIGNTYVDSDLTNFPLCVKISNDSDIGATALSNGYDIRFTAADGTTLLDYERESWSGGGGSAANGVFWVKVPVVAHASSTTIYVYYGKSNALDAQKPTSVWDSNFKGVWHLGNGTALSVLDATSNANSGTNSGAVVATGEVNSGARFNGSSSYVAVPRAVQNDWTISFWMNAAATGSTGSQWYSGCGLVDGEVGGTANDFGVTWVGDKVAFGVGNSDTTIFSSSLSLNTWYYVTATRVSSTGQMVLYVNGTEVARRDTGPVGTRNATSVLNFGRIQTGVRYFNGILDETRLSATVRSAAWTKFECRNANSATGELSWLSQEVNGTAQNVVISSLVVSPQSVTGGIPCTFVARLSSAVSGETVVFYDETSMTVIGNAVTDADGIARCNYAVSDDNTGVLAVRATYGNSSTTLVVKPSALTLKSLSITRSQASVGGLGTGIVTNNASLVFDCGGAATISNAIGGTGGIVQCGSGTVVLSGSNTYTGSTTVNGGTLQLGNSEAIGVANADVIMLAGTLDLHGNSVSIRSLRGSGGTITDHGTSAGTSVLTVNTIVNTTYGGLLCDGETRHIAIAKTGAGTLILAGANTHTGGTTVDAGTVQLGNTNALGNAAASLTVNDGIVDLEGHSVTLGSLSGVGGIITDCLTGTGVTTLTLSPTEGVSRFAGVIQDGSSRTLAVTKGLAGTVVLSGVNTYTGATTVTGGTLSFANGSLGSGTITFAGGALQWADGNTQDVSGRIAAIASGKSAIFDTNGNRVVFSHTLSGAGSLIKMGVGTLALTGSNAYAGGTTISGGSLQLGDGATNGSVVGNITDNSVLVFANVAAQTFSSVINGNGSVVKDGAGTLTITSINTYHGGTTLNNGVLRLSGTITNTNSTIDLGNGSGTWRLIGGKILGGTITASGGSGFNVVAGGPLEGVGGTLDGVTLNANATVQDVTLTIVNGMTLNGTITMPSTNFAGLVFTGSQTLAGAGEIAINNANDTFQAAGTGTIPATLTIGSGITIRGKGTISGSYSNDQIANHGTILGDAANATLTVSATMTNTGILARSGTGSLVINNLRGDCGTVLPGTSSIDTGLLRLNGNWSSSHPLAIYAGTLGLWGTWSNAGMPFHVYGGTVNLNGNFTTAGLGDFQYTAGTVNLVGALVNTASTLSLGSTTGVWNLNGGTIIGGTVTASDGTWLQCTGGTSTLDGVILDTDMTVSSSAVLNIKNSLVLDGALTLQAGDIRFLGIQSLTGGGQLILANDGGHVYIIGTGSTANATLTVGSGITILGKGLINKGIDGDCLVNEGTISGGSSGGLNLYVSVVNHGVLKTNGAGNLVVANLQTSDGTIQAGTASTDTGILTINGNWSNADGTMIVCGGVMALGGTFTTAGIGTFSHTAGTVNVTGTMTNTDDVLSLGAASGVWNINGGTIRGGVINADSGTWLRAITSNSTLDGVTLNADIQLAANVALTMKNGLTLNGKMTMSPNARLVSLGTQTLSGTGEVVMGFSDNSIYIQDAGSSSAETLTIGTGITVHGMGLITRSLDRDYLINHGTIRGEVDNMALTVAAKLYNSGTLTRSGAGNLTIYNLQGDCGTLLAGTTSADTGTLSITGSWSNSHGVTVAAGALNLGGTWSNSGTLDLNGGSASLGGSWSNTGAITVHHGNISLNGSWVSTGAALTLDSGTVNTAGSWSNTGGSFVINGGTLTLGGTFTTAGIGAFAYTAGTVNLTGVLTNTGATLNLGSTTGLWNLNGGTIIGGIVAASSGTWLQTTNGIGTLDGVTLDADLGVCYQVNVLNGLTLNGTIVGMPRLYFQGTQALVGTGRIVMNDYSHIIQVKGTDSTSPAQLTIGSGITIDLSGTISGYYSGDSIVNEGLIQVNAGSSSTPPTISALFSNEGTVKARDTGKLLISHLQSNTGTIQSGASASDLATVTLGGTWTNAGTFLVVGNSVLNKGSAQISGSANAISGTEVYLTWSGFDEGETHQLAQSSNGTEYVTLGALNNDDISTLVSGMIRNSDYYLRTTVTSAAGGQEIYDSGLVSTLDEEDTSGWYRLTSILADSDGSELTPQSIGLDFTQNDGWMYAGSKQGLALAGVQGLVTDGTLPHVDADGNVKVYQVITYGCNAAASANVSSLETDSLSLVEASAADPVMTSSASGSDALFTADPDAYVPGWSVSYEFIPYTLNLLKSLASRVAQTIKDLTSDPIRYSDGSIEYSATDIASSVPSGLSVSRSWEGSTKAIKGQHNGRNWINDSNPVIQISNNGRTVTVIRSGSETEAFQFKNGTYTPTVYSSDTLIHDTTNH